MKQLSQPITQVFLLIIIFLLIGCAHDSTGKNKTEKENVTTEKTTKKAIEIHSNATTLNLRIAPPKNFQRTTVSENSFAKYLRTIKLKPAESKVNFYDGRIKNPEGIYLAVIDLEIGKKDLHQCADAIMRLRAEYLWKNKKYDKIHFNFTNGFRVDYSKWMEGKRIEVKGNSTKWNNRKSFSNSYEDFWKYLETIFMYAGTASLEKELKPVAIKDMKIGDVFIQGGHPGHAVIVMDMAVNETTNKKVFLLAQSYMPAQETQLLINPTDNQKSPWYSLNDNNKIITPEWTFSKNDLKRFEE